jgi:hypothetical protein
MTGREGGAAGFDADAEVEELVRRLESCSISPDEFGHREHLAVALVYVLRGDEEEARARMRGSILRLLKHHHIEEPVYHETITDFWLRRVRSFAASAGPRRPLHELANELCRLCADSRLVFDYYSKPLIDSAEARAAIVAPDLKTFDF